MRLSCPVLVMLLATACTREAPKESAAYADPKLCANCHPAQARTYAQTGMGQSFRRAGAAEIEGFLGSKTSYAHPASDRHYQIVKRGDTAVMRRFQRDAEGRESNVFEATIDYVVGSGRHSRSFLHRAEDNRLAQLPVSWYAENGGSLAMSPGYDSPAHPDFRRKIAGDCFACHNAYPTSGADGVFPAVLPEGIDCQRCHGPGQRHIDAVQSNRDAAEVKKVIVNPKRLPADRQMEVCLQCHLETTSFELPNALLREGHNAFSYRPGEPLGDHQLHFDHAPGKGRDDKFEIAGAAYRLRQSPCFLKSGGALRCTTCHNPHDIPRGAAAITHYAAACRTCHGDKLQASIAARKHTDSPDCAGCHMPKRRTEDVVHVVMTDHLIQRRKSSANLLAARAERHEKAGEGYRGPVVLYYPDTIQPAADRDAYLGLAQVAQGSNLADGIAQLERAAQAYGAQRPQIHVDLAAAYATTGAIDKALASYRTALAAQPKSLAALRGLGSTLLRSGDVASAVDVLKQALAQEPDAATQQELGRAYYTLGRLPEAIQALESAVSLDPDLTEARDALGNMRAESGDLAGAEQSLREAIRRQPDFATSHGNLGKVLIAKGAVAEAEQSYRKAIALAPANGAVRFSYGAALASMGRWAAAEAQVGAAVAAQPELAEPHEMLGNLFARRGDWSRAANSYRQALRIKPQYGRAHLGLGTALAALRDLDGARRHLRVAATDADADISAEAAEILKAMGTIH
jgi:tetratricopeptide (TPR) repeat protein